MNDFLGGLIELFESSTAGEQKKKTQPAADTEKLEQVHAEVLKAIDTNYFPGRESENGRILYRRKEHRFVFVFKPGILESIVAKCDCLIRDYLRYAKATGKIATTGSSYKIVAEIDQRFSTYYAVYCNVQPAEPEGDSPEEITYKKLIAMFMQNEAKFDKRGKNEYGRRLSVNHKTCYAVQPEKLPVIVSSLGGNTDKFIQWCKDNGKLLLENNSKNTVNVDFYDTKLDMYGIMRI